MNNMLKSYDKVGVFYRYAIINLMQQKLTKRLIQIMYLKEYIFWHIWPWCFKYKGYLRDAPAN